MPITRPIECTVSGLETRFDIFRLRESNIDQSFGGDLDVGASMWMTPFKGIRQILEIGTIATGVMEFTNLQSTMESNCMDMLIREFCNNCDDSPPNTPRLMFELRKQLFNNWLYQWRRKGLGGASQGLWPKGKEHHLAHFMKSRTGPIEHLGETRHRRLGSFAPLCQ
jgi:hypothetical protein